MACEHPSAPVGAVGRPDGDADVGGRVVRGSAMRIASLGITNALLAVGAIVLLRYLGVDDFGRYGTVMALLVIVQGVTDAGLTITGTRELSLIEGDERRELLSHILGLRIILTGVGVVAAVLFAIAVGYDRELVLGTVYVGVGVFLFSVQAAMLLPLSVELRNGTLGLNDVIRQSVMVGGWLVLVALGAGLEAFWALQIVIGVVLIAIVPLLVGRRHLVRPRWERTQMRTLAATGLPIAIAGVVAIIYYRVLTVMVSLLSTTEQTGLFVSASRVFEVAFAVPFVMVTVVLPVMTVAARSDLVRLRYVIQRMTETMMLAGVTIGLLVAGAAEPILVVVGGEQYRAAAPALRFLALALVSMFTGAAWSPVLIATGRQRLLAYASLLGLVLVLALGFVLIPALDAEGAAISFAVADWALLGALYVALRRIGHGTHLDFAFLGRLVPLTAVACAVVFAPWIGSEVIRTAVGVSLLAAGIVGLGLLPSEVVDAIRTGWGRVRRRSA